LNKEFYEYCDVCHRGGQTRSTFPLSDSRAKRPFSLIHCDLWGRYHIPSLSGCHYFLSIVDVYSSAIWVFLLKDKIETFEKLVNFHAMVKTQFGLAIQRVCSDHGVKFMDRKVQKFLIKNNIITRPPVLIHLNKMVGRTKKS